MNILSLWPKTEKLYYNTKYPKPPFPPKCYKYVSNHQKFTNLKFNDKIEYILPENRNSTFYRNNHYMCKFPHFYEKVY